GTAIDASRQSGDDLSGTGGCLFGAYEDLFGAVRGGAGYLVVGSDHLQIADQEADRGPAAEDAVGIDGRQFVVVVGSGVRSGRGLNRGPSGSCRGTAAATTSSPA